MTVQAKSLKNKLRNLAVKKTPKYRYSADSHLRMQKLWL